MSAQREVVLRPLGLITAPNKYGQFPPGAMSKAKNVTFWKPGVCGTRKSSFVIKANVATTVFLIIPIGLSGSSTAYLVWGDSANVKHVLNAGAITNVTKPAEIPTATTWTYLLKKTWWARMRARVFVSNSDLGVAAFDEAISYTAPRMAGFPAPFMYGVTSNTTNGQSQPTAKVRRYKCLIRRVMSDGYELVSEPSGSLLHTNSSGSTADLSPAIYWQDNHGAKAGDYVELYRTLDVASGSDPGETYYLVGTRVLVNADFTGGAGVGKGAISFYDRSLDAAIDGAQNPFLYTTEEGDDQANAPPPPADDVAAFAGHMFYLSPTVAANYAFSVTGKYGVLATAAERTYGIGRREITGDTHTTETVDGIAAGNMAGLAVGQRITGAGIPANTRITAVGAASVTLSQAATATAAGVTIQCTDVIEYGAGASDFVTMANTTTAGGDTLYPEVMIAGGSAANLLQWQRVTSLETENGVGETLIDGPSFVVRALRAACGTFTLRATNGQNYAPKLPDISSTAVAAKTDAATNRLHYSKADKPDAVPLNNTLRVGAGVIYRAVPTRDALWVFASDGLHRVTGRQPPWSVDTVDPNCCLHMGDSLSASTTLIDPRPAVCVLNDDLYCVDQSRGLLRITAGGEVVEVSRGVVDIYRLDGGLSNFLGTYSLAADHVMGDVFIVGKADARSCFIYNAFTGCWATFDDGDDMVAPAWDPIIESVVWSNSDGAAWDLRTYNSSKQHDTGEFQSGCEVRFQPLVGDGDPFSKKEWISVEYLFDGFGSGATLVPSFAGTNYAARTVPSVAADAKCKVSVPRNAPAVAPNLLPGFTFTAGATTQPWSLRGARALWNEAGEEARR